MTRRALTVYVDAGETECGGCKYNEVRAWDGCELFGSFGPYISDRVPVRLPECLAAEKAATERVP